MNYSEFNESIRAPLFEKKGEEPQCPDGYKWNKKLGRCVPAKVQNKGENPGDKYRSLNGNFSVWGATGIDGDGYALEDDGNPSAEAAASASVSEGVVTEMKSDWLSDHKYQKRLADEERRNKAQDERMKYGRKGKPMDEVPLKKGEVRSYNKQTGKWESNK